MTKETEKYLQRMFKKRKCAECGREFETIDLNSWALKIKVGTETRYFDRYNCMQKHKKKFKKFIKTPDNYVKM